MEGSTARAEGMNVMVRFGSLQIYLETFRGVVSGLTRSPQSCFAVIIYFKRQGEPALRPRQAQAPVLRSYVQNTRRMRCDAHVQALVDPLRVVPSPK